MEQGILGRKQQVNLILNPTIRTDITIRKRWRPFLGPGKKRAIPPPITKLPKQSEDRLISWKYQFNIYQSNITLPARNNLKTTNMHNKRSRCQYNSRKSKIFSISNDVSWVPLTNHFKSIVSQSILFDEMAEYYTPKLRYRQVALLPLPLGTPHPLANRVDLVFFVS